ncbi:MarR family winged helix-turn-helix transcriptional regulator [Acuticoccus sediminis]|uniref:MarR family winged helix-turn-helix transcriptional regulator n=1 Tax=Acuticoccus sediminis TaxID=2184697 RepID=UPI001CFE9E2D|nr:MarR family transcriptional regulator [Acuticoccus sediminis]
MEDIWGERTNPTALVFERFQQNWPEMRTPAMALAIMIQRLARLIRESARASLEPFGISLTEFEAMAALRSHPAPHRVMPSALYDTLLITSGGLTKVLKGLETRGLIHRPLAEGDGRLRPVELTAKGIVTVEAAMRAVQAADARLLRDGLGGDGEFDRFVGSLTNLLACAEDRRPRHE